MFVVWRAMMDRPRNAIFDQCCLWSMLSLISCLVFCYVDYVVFFQGTLIQKSDKILNYMVYTACACTLWPYFGYREVEVRRPKTKFCFWRSLLFKTNNFNWQTNTRELYIWHKEIVSWCYIKVSEITHAHSTGGQAQRPSSITGLNITEGTLHCFLEGSMFEIKLSKFWEDALQRITSLNLINKGITTWLKDANIISKSWAGAVSSWINHQREQGRPVEHEFQKIWYGW